MNKEVLLIVEKILERTAYYFEMNVSDMVGKSNEERYFEARVYFIQTCKFVFNMKAKEIAPFVNRSERQIYNIFKKDLSSDCLNFINKCDIYLKNIR